MSIQAEEYVKQAERALEACEPALAIKFLERAIEASSVSIGDADTSPTASAKLFQLFGWAHMELVNTLTNDSPDSVDIPAAMESAKTAFLHAIQLAPNQDYATYLCLGQLVVAKESIGYYEIGVKLLTQLIHCHSELAETPEQTAVLQQKLGSALCSMIEIYMTDCCDEPEAEDKCEEYVQHALAENPTNPEVYQTLASVRLSQSRPAEARVCLEKSMDLWYTEPKEDAPLVADPAWIGYPLRVSLAKLLMEVELNERALVVLQTCQVEDDEDAEIWYLYGWCYLQLSSSHAEFKEDAHACFDSVLELDGKYPGTVDPAMLCHIKELRELADKINHDRDDCEMNE
ncbi:hypothetical protein BASA50_006642 [Batrachochytrium salamandrivorans]|uniref:Uncharacterized protein n=1 Tax=Batrachochytrium salamandrivorans TaxID=1357716 RepID=A0ABQ8F989_9FUNG|nr:hypothetical protein BASA62_000252 [Batrachochytrium salamandrivorans]KAH6560384.1 hypothetical protein BASA60_000305 [Batrachochytrium salamandrivorans]KAH6578343.1 hypothetical protein BASA61_000335 [Batrachochytrium salamandrivorans]KAH6594395.1 hypothetical protein BASA50_006642 [Batrachochytrium salamandrivorans]KAH9252175.1 hypothetical protein BASA81_009926 [Batrachochytrium salamandrivorans]